MGDVVQTLGYYAVNDGGAGLYQITSTEDLISIQIKNGLYANLIIKDSFNLAQLGGKANDNTFDNSSYIKKGIEILSVNNGGKFIIPTGKWYCKTTIVVNSPVYGASIVGESRGVDGEKGSTIIFTGSGMFLTFNEKTNHFTLKDFSVELSDTAYFIQFNYTFHKGIMKNIHVSGGLGCIDLNTGTYPLFDNIGYTTGVANAEYGIRIGAGGTVRTTEFVYIERCSFDFQRIGKGSGIEVLNMNGGLWVRHCDICNTKGSAIKIHNKRGSTIAYFNFDDNNISGAKIGFDLYGETGSLAGVYISNQRIACNFEDKAERFISTNAGSGLTVDVKTNGMYLRSRTGGTNPQYVYELLKISPDSIITFDGGEKFDFPIYLQRAIKKLYDFRMNYNRVLTHTNYQDTGDYEIPLSKYKCLVLENETFYHPGIVGSDTSIGYIKTTYPDGVPTANIRIKEDKIPNQRIFIHVSEELQQENALF